MKRQKLLLLAGVAAAFTAGAALAKSLSTGSNPPTPSICGAIPENLVKNCGFEEVFDAIPANWVFRPAASGSFFGVGPGIQHSGTNAAYFGATSPPNVDTLEQTIDIVPGDFYRVTFFLANGQEFRQGAPSHFTASLTFFDHNFEQIGVQEALLSLTNPEVSPYTEFTAIREAPGGAAFANLSFSAYQVLDFFYLDDVSVAPAPEPATLGLMVLGLLGVGFAGRKRGN